MDSWLDQKKSKTIIILLSSGFAYVFLRLRIVIHVSECENVGLPRVVNAKMQIVLLHCSCLYHFRLVR